MSAANVWSVTLRAFLGFCVALSLAGPMVAQQRKLVTLIVETPDSDVDCPAFETALKDAFAVSPQYELVDFSRLNEAMLFTVSCLSLHDPRVISVYYTIQNFDDYTKAKTSPLFSTGSTGHKLVIKMSSKDLANSVLVSFDQSVKKHYQP